MKVPFASRFLRGPPRRRQTCRSRLPFPGKEEVLVVGSSCGSSSHFHLAVRHSSTYGTARKEAHGKFFFFFFFPLGESLPPSFPPSSSPSLCVVAAAAVRMQKSVTTRRNATYCCQRRVPTSTSTSSTTTTATVAQEGRNMEHGGTCQIGTDRDGRSLHSWHAWHRAPRTDQHQTTTKPL